MKYSLKMAMMFGQESAVQRYGDKLWEEVCDTFTTGETFTLKDILARTKTLGHLAPATQMSIVRAIMRNVEEEYNDPLMEGVKRPLARVNRAVWKLV